MHCLFHNMSSKFLLNIHHFRIKRKHQTCSKRASNLVNTSWPDSVQLLRIYSIDEIKKNYPVAHTYTCTQLLTPTPIMHFLQFLIFSWWFLRIYGNCIKRNLDNFYLFLFSQEVTEMPQPESNSVHINFQKIL